MVGKKFTVDNLSGAEYLASIYGTERDKVNCYFYYRVGACRFGEKCTRQHIKPVYSRTVLLKNLYKNPAFTGDAKSDNRVEHTPKLEYDEQNDVILCRQNDVNNRCPEGVYCNFLHLRVLTDEADRRIRKIFEQYCDRRFVDAYKKNRRKKFKKGMEKTKHLAAKDAAKQKSLSQEKHEKEEKERSRQFEKYVYF
uniref:C3H1-type domain-containing protein n=1 Tax=Steinernema glaseri TaxID=37863 RepID=A0A1I7YKD6_9BILA